LSVPEQSRKLTTYHRSVKCVWITRAVFGILRSPKYGHVKCIIFNILARFAN